MLVIIILLVTGCASLSTANTDRWFEYELPPSKINYTGNVFMNAKLSDGSMCYVFSDKEISSDGDYYYSILMQDFGWHKTKDGWSGYDARRAKRGCMYINPKRQVAIYFYPKETFDAFKVKIESKTNSY
jgi:hypothetical protein